MALTLPDYETIRSTILSIWQSERPNADATRFSDLWLYSRITARLVHRLHQTIDRALNALFPATTSGEYLDYWLELIGADDGGTGYGRIQARGSSGTNCLTVTATGAATVTAGDQLTDTAGRVYQIDDTHVYPGAGTFDHDVSAIDTGVETNLETGDVLTFVSTPLNITSTATLVSDLDGGADLETDAEGRARLLRLLQTPPITGTAASLRKIIDDAIPGSIRGYVWNARQNSPYGYGCVDYAATQIGESRGDRDTSSAQDTIIQAAVVANFPVALYYQARQLDISTSATAIDVTYTLKSGATSDSECDFDAESVKRTVASHSHPSGTTTRVVASGNICSPTITGGLEVDDVVMINGYLSTVTAVNVGAVATTFDCGFEWGTENIDGKYICSGGGAAPDVYQGILDYCDSLFPEMGTYYDPHDTGDDTIRLIGIRTAAMNASSALVDVVVNSPGADAAPAASTGATVELKIAGEIRVWEDKP